MMFTCPSGSGGGGDSSPSRVGQVAGLFLESPRPLNLQHTLSSQPEWGGQQPNQHGLCPSRQKAGTPRLRAHRPDRVTLGELCIPRASQRMA